MTAVQFNPDNLLQALEAAIAGAHDDEELEAAIAQLAAQVSTTYADAKLAYACRLLEIHLQTALPDALNQRFGNFWQAVTHGARQALTKSVGQDASDALLAEQNHPIPAPTRAPQFDFAHIDFHGALAGARSESSHLRPVATGSTEQIQTLFALGRSETEIAREIFGRDDTETIAQVKQVLQQAA